MSRRRRVGLAGGADGADAVPFGIGPDRSRVPREVEAETVGRGQPRLLADERDAARRGKRKRPILVIPGNPPCDACAGTSPAEERGLIAPDTEGLRKLWGIRKFNLDDLHVRFFRLAERRIAEQTGLGVVCCISGHSWLRYPSFAVMRERLPSRFDRIRIDNLNGSRQVAPDGSPHPPVFSTEANR